MFPRCDLCHEERHTLIRVALFTPPSQEKPRKAWLCRSCLAERSDLYHD